MLEAGVRYLLKVFWMPANFTPGKEHAEGVRRHDDRQMNSNLFNGISPTGNCKPDDEPAQEAQRGKWKIGAAPDKAGEHEFSRLQRAQGGP
ncbi:MAG: hypothetical protein JW929_03010 [Anaerolineales bacterium]|nr:hypothetical protein [Anaerolineales bacterium]